MRRDPVFLRAAGAVTAAGVGVPALGRAVGDPAWVPKLGISRADGPPLPVAVCSAFAAREHLPLAVVRRLTRPALLLAVAAREALAAVGRPLPWDDTRFALTSATMNAGTSAIVEILREVFLGHPDEAPPSQFLSTVAHAPASQVAILEELRGPNVTYAEKQVGGIRAIIEATRILHRARADAVLACGVDEAHWITAEGYRRIGVLRHGTAPGMVLGEGATALALALTPGPAPLARLAGWGSASTPAPPWCYPERPDGLIRACTEALAMAGLDAAEIDATCTLSNGIAILDRLETELIRSVFGGHRPAVINVTPLGEGAFAGSLRVLTAACAIAGRCEPRWPAPAGLAARGLRILARPPRHVLVPGLASGGSAAAVVLSAV